MNRRQFISGIVGIGLGLWAAPRAPIIEGTVALDRAFRQSQDFVCQEMARTLCQKSALCAAMAAIGG
jgi:hypothetical protein